MNTDEVEVAKEQAEYYLAQEARAKELGRAFNSLRSHPDFNYLIELMLNLQVAIEKATMTMQDTEGVRWYQAEWAILESIIKKINEQQEPEQEPAEPTE